MGILHSTNRSSEDEGGERPIYPHLRRQGESSKVSIFASLTYNGVKSLLHKFRFIFYLTRRRKAADPLLPIQNPESGLSSEPLLDKTTLISSSTHDSSHVLSISVSEEREETDSRNDVPIVVEAEREEEKKVKIKNIILVSEEREETDSRNDVPFVVEAEREEEKKVKIKNIILVSEERWIKHYSSRHRILLVGDGDFSFSASLAVAFGSASNIIATSLDSHAFLKSNYRRALSNIEKLKTRGSIVMHEIDATIMANHALLGQLRFDRIIYNFPYAGLDNLKKLSRDSQLRRHRRLVSLFLKNAKEMISETGEIHISHKTNGFHVEFKLEHVASSHRLRLIEAVKFDCVDYPGYRTKCGFGGDNNFDCNPGKTYKFGLKRLPS